ncbi:MAG: hypothetical protein LBQ79_14265 [Deltaproteobacteria bacterium]|jgi:hypothetical protein|nr:hypothetical protein [Deltaproteobacteria bacterium]
MIPDMPLVYAAAAAVASLAAVLLLSAGEALASGKGPQGGDMFEGKVGFKLFATIVDEAVKVIRDGVGGELPSRQADVEKELDDLRTGFLKRLDEWRSEIAKEIEDGPEWDFPSMGRLLERMRTKAEADVSEARFLKAAFRWEDIRAMAAMAFGSGEHRSVAALSRAARSLVYSMADDMAKGRRFPISSNRLGAGGMCGEGLLAEGNLAASEREYWEAFLHEGYFDDDRHDRRRRPSLSLHEALWRGLPPGQRRDAEGLAGAGGPLGDDGWDVAAEGAGAAAEALRRELGGSVTERGEGSGEVLALRSRLGGALAAGDALAGVRRSGDGPSGGEAESLLRGAVEGFTRLQGASGLPGPVGPDAQEAHARLALFLMRGYGPATVLPPPGGDAPPRRDLAEALSLWNGIIRAPARSLGAKARRTDAEIMAADCMFRMGRRTSADALRDSLLDRMYDYGGLSGKRRGRILVGCAESSAASGEYGMAAGLLREALGRFRDFWGQDSRETIRAQVKLARVKERLGRGVSAACLRALAAESLERACGPETPEVHVLRCTAAKAFIRAGDLALAGTVIASGHAHLVRLLGEDDPRTVKAAALLKKASLPPGSGTT